MAVGALFSTAAAAEEWSQESIMRVAAAHQPASSHRPLDLRPPHITQLLAPEQIDRILAATFREDIEEVEVEGARDRLPVNTPDVWPGIAAPFWALLHPTQAWRIFGPLPPDQTRGLQFVRANATDSYVLEPAGVP